MTVLIIGHPDSGKSKIAEDMVMEMSAPGGRIYLATMIPCGEEGRVRVEKHRNMRAGKGFVTIEAPFDPAEALDPASPGRTLPAVTGTSSAAGTIPDATGTYPSSAAESLHEADRSAVLSGELKITDPGSSTVLLECLSNLVANELFERHTDTAVLADRIADDISRLSAKVRNLVIVSNHFNIEAGFDADTVTYAEMMDSVNDRISRMADRTIRL